MSEKRNTYTAVLFLAGLLAGLIFLGFGVFPAQGGFLPTQRTAQAVTRRRNGPDRAPSLRRSRPILGKVGLLARLPGPEEAADAVQDFLDGAETAVNASLDREHTFIQLYGGAQRLMGRRSVEDMDPKYTVVRLEDGLLTFADLQDAQEDRSVMAREMISFARRVKFRYDVPLLYLQVPSKLDTSPLPEGVVNYADAEADQFLSLLSEAGVDILDLRPAFRRAAAGDETVGRELFFRTDHHWTPAGAFLGFQELCDKLEADYDFWIEDDYVDDRQYDRYTFEDLFLGSQGKRVGSLYAGLDDVEVWVPKFSTDFTYTVPMSFITREGPFPVSLLFPEMVTEKGSLYDTNPYVIWSGGDFLLTRAVNKKNPDGPRILVLRDSYGCTFTPFLSLLGSETITMDGRMFSGDQDEMLDYIHWLEPDLIIVMNAASSLEVDGLFPYLPTNRANNLAAKAAEREK